MSELHRSLEILERAKTPEDVFGLGNFDETETKYRILARALHPDKNGGSRLASQAMSLLNIWWDKAQVKFKQGRWGTKDSGVSIKTATKVYKNVTELAAGDVCDVYLGEQENGPRVVIKVCYPGENDLVQNEAKVLRKLWKPTDKAAVYTQQFLPKLLEQTKIVVDGKERLANIFEACEQGYTLEHIRERYPAGIDARNVAWIWKRMVEGLTWVHEQGVIHGAIVPSHILVYPKNHGMCILDWSYACSDQALKARVVKYKDFYPREVMEKKPAKPSLDIYMIARCAEYLLSDEHGRVPDHTPKMFNAMIRACSLPAFHRSNDLREVHEQLTENLRKTYGPRKFVELEM